VYDLDRRLCIELHWSLTDRFTQAGADTAQFVRSAQPLDTRQPELGFGLAPTWNLIYLALHLAKHAVLNQHLVGRADFADLSFEPVSDSRLIWLLDMALVARHGGVDWEQLAASAHSAGIGRSVQTSLAAVEALLGPDALPEEAGELREPPSLSRWRSWMASRSVMALRPGHGLRGRVARAVISAHPRTQMRPLRLLTAPDALLPSLDGLAARRGTSRRRASLAYPAHALGVLARGGLTALRLIYQGLQTGGGDERA
jgi:hypothetical protein